MNTYKDSLIAQLIRFIESDSQYLTRDDQDKIIREINELNDSINRTYQERHSTVFSLNTQEA